MEWPIAFLQRESHGSLKAALACVSLSNDPSLFAAIPVSSYLYARNCVSVSNESRCLGRRFSGSRPSTLHLLRQCRSSKLSRRSLPTEPAAPATREISIRGSCWYLYADCRRRDGNDVQWKFAGPWIRREFPELAANWTIESLSLDVLGCRKGREWLWTSYCSICLAWIAFYWYQCTSFHTHKHTHTHTHTHWSKSFDVIRLEGWTFILCVRRWNKVWNEAHTMLLRTGCQCVKH